MRDSIRLNICILLTAVSRQINSSVIITARASQLIREREQLCLCLGVIILRLRVTKQNTSLTPHQTLTPPANFKLLIKPIKLAFNAGVQTCVLGSVGIPCKNKTMAHLKRHGNTEDIYKNWSNKNPGGIVELSTKQLYIDLGRQVDGWRLKEVN